MLTGRDVRRTCPGLPLYEREPMANHTSFRIGGPVDLLALPRGADEAAALLKLAARNGMPVFRMGNGTNLLVSDAGIRGLVVKTHPGLARIERRGETGIFADAGAPLSHIAERAAEWGLNGLAFAHGIPGTAGGAAVMNAGAYGGEMSQVIWETNYIDADGAPGVLTGAAHDFDYRHSWFTDHPELTVTGVVFRLSPGDPEEIRREMAKWDGERQAKQPVDPSAGSVFKRPPGHYVGPMIEGCGLKGYAVGGAQVSEKHAGFIVNRGGATCEDVMRVIEHVRERVLVQYGVELTCELRMVGA